MPRNLRELAGNVVAIAGLLVAFRIRNTRLALAAGIASIALGVHIGELADSDKD